MSIILYHIKGTIYFFEYMSITYTVEKKENTRIIQSALEIHYYQKFHHFISMPFFENFATP